MCILLLSLTTHLNTPTMPIFLKKPRGLLTALVSFKVACGVGEVIPQAQYMFTTLSNAVTVICIRPMCSVRGSSSGGDRVDG